MPDPVALSQAGPVAILIAGIIAMVIGFVRGDVVPGWLYRQERAQREKAEAQAEQNALALAVLARTASVDQRRRDANDA
jgi:hypothetical protein